MEATDIDCMVLVLAQVSVRFIFIGLLHLELADHDNIAHMESVTVRVKASPRMTNLDCINPCLSTSESLSKTTKTRILPVRKALFVEILLLTTGIQTDRALEEFQDLSLPPCHPCNSLPAVHTVVQQVLPQMEQHIPREDIYDQSAWFL